MTAAGFWSRATLALALALYGWSMMGIELYLHAAPLPEGPDRGLALFRRLVMGRAVVGLGGVAVLAAIVLGLWAMRTAQHRLVASAALVVAALWLVCLAVIWPV